MANKINTIAELVVSVFSANGVKRIFGVPGGGSSLDIMEAAAAVGIDFQERTGLEALDSGHSCLVKESAPAYE